MYLQSSVHNRKGSYYLTPTATSVGTLVENFDQRCRQIAYRQETELSKEIEETVSILTKEKLVIQQGGTFNLKLKSYLKLSSLW